MPVRLIKRYRNKNRMYYLGYNTQIGGLGQSQEEYQIRLDIDIDIDTIGYVERIMQRYDELVMEIVVVIDIYVQSIWEGEGDLHVDAVS